MLINRNRYQNIFQLTLDFHRVNYRAVGAFCTICVFTLSNFFPEIHFLKMFSKNRFYHLIEHDS